MTVWSELVDHQIILSGAFTSDEQDQLSALNAETLSNALLDRGAITTFQRDQIVAGRIARLITGKYVLLEPCGVGGMGQVYRGRSQTGEAVAIKLLLSTRQSDPFTLKRFEREIRLVQRVDHPNVVKIVDVIRDADGRLAVVMPWMSGGDLEDRVRNEGAVDWRQALSWALEAASGLRAVHAAGILHRDIKPSNLLIDSQGHLAVADFGVAKVQGDETQTELTQAGGLVGTVEYVAPEAVEGSSKLDSRSDIYSLACVTYFLVKGHPPFSGSNAVEVLLAHGEAARPSLDVGGDDLRLFQSSLHRWMAIDPSQRPANVDAFVREAELLLSGEAIKRDRRDRRWRRVSNLAILCAVGGLLFLWITNRRLQREQERVATLLVSATDREVDESQRTPVVRSAPVAQNWQGFFTKSTAGESSWSLISNATTKGVSRAAWFEDGSRIVAIHRNELRAYESTRGELVAYFERDGVRYVDCSVAPQTERVIALASDGSVDLLSGDLQRIATWNVSESGSTYESIQWSPDGRQIAVRAKDRIVILDGFGRERINQVVDRLSQCGWSQDSTQLLLVSDGACSILDGDGVINSLEVPPPIAPEDDVQQDAAESTKVLTATWVDNNIFVITDDSRLFQRLDGGWIDYPHDAVGLSSAKAMCYDPARHRLRFIRSGFLGGLTLSDERKNAFYSGDTSGIRVDAIAVNSKDGRAARCHQYFGMEVVADDGRELWQVSSADARDEDYRTSNSRFYEIGLSWTADGQLLLASRAARLQRWSADGILLEQYQTVLPSPQKLVRRPDETYWVVSDQSVMIEWDVRKNRQRLFPSPRNSILFSNRTMDINAADDCIAVADRIGSLDMYDFNLTPVEFRSVSNTFGVVGVTWHPNDDQFFLTRSGEGQSRLCDREGKLIVAPADAIRHAAAWVPGSRTLLLPTTAGRKLWDVDTLQTRDSQLGDGTPVFSPSGSNLILLTPDNISLWDAQDEQMRWRSNIPLELGSAVFSDDESMIAAVILDNEAVVVLDADSGDLKWCLLSGDRSESVVVDGTGQLIYGTLGELDRRSSVLRVIEDDVTELQSVSDVFSGAEEIDP